MIENTSASYTVPGVDAFQFWFLLGGSPWIDERTHAPYHGPGDRAATGFLCVRSAKSRPPHRNDSI